MQGVQKIPTSRTLLQHIMWRDMRSRSDGAKRSVVKERRSIVLNLASTSTEHSCLGGGVV